MFQKLLDSPLGALGKSLIGDAVPVQASGRFPFGGPRAPGRGPARRRLRCPLTHDRVSRQPDRPLTNRTRDRPWSAPTKTSRLEPLILELLARRNWFQPKQLEKIEEAISKAGSGTLPEATLIRGGYISEQEVTRIYGEDLFLPVISSNVEAGADRQGSRRPAAGEALPGSAGVCPPRAGRRPGRPLRLARGDGRRRRAPTDDGAADQPDHRPALGRPGAARRPLQGRRRTPRESARAARTSTCPSPRRTSTTRTSSTSTATPPADANGRIVRMVNQILEQALRNGASDIHLEPFEDGCKFRLRIDGVLHELPSPSKTAFIMIISRLKVLAKMDIAEKRIPQDGAIALRTGDKRVDLRVNTVPTVHGEKMVMRILDKGAIPLEPDRAGARRAAVDRPDGIDPLPLRPGPGDRPDRQRQVDHALLLPEPAQRLEGRISARSRTRSSTSSRG